jgi:NTE family protein
LDKFPLKTTKDEQQPRLLLVTVDVQEGATVIFDSYDGKLKKNDKGEGISKDENGKSVYEFKAEYGEYDKEAKKYKQVIEYSKGLTIDHVLASASVSIAYDYQDINGHTFWDGYYFKQHTIKRINRRAQDVLGSRDT